MQYGVGLEGVDIEEATRKCIIVSNIPSALCGNAEATAEHAIYLTLSALRNPNISQKVFESGSLGNPLTRQILGKSVTIIGYGNVASRLLQRLIPFGPKDVTVMRRSMWDSKEEAALRNSLYSSMKCAGVERLNLIGGIWLFQINTVRVQYSFGLTLLLLLP